MDLATKTQQAICKYHDVPAAEAQSRFVQMTAEEHALIAAAFDDAASGKCDPKLAKSTIENVWKSSCERRASEASLGPSANEAVAPAPALEAVTPKTEDDTKEFVPEKPEIAPE